MKNFIYFLVLMLATSLFFRCINREEKKEYEPAIINGEWVNPPVTAEHTELQKYFISKQTEPCLISNSANEAVYCLNFKQGDTVFATKEKDIFNGQGAWWASEHETTFYRIASDGIVQAVSSCY